ncbi:hypothetical protein [Myroides sp. WP-1]|uniref:hypothetical protein n=1 Tax=Myroides sp. WP-1 TaxID=2759944 RepID=UPI0015F7933F|nr:hypothetical protein [Myroides sp. WP-1]MBB1139664.1 hypothetical protein [Myroides sp. WP-1]
MKKMYLYCSIIFMLSFSTYAQKEANNWFYGYGQGITWNSTQTFEGIPIDAPNTRVNLTGIPTRYESQSVRPQMYPIRAAEGCFSLSDENGKLLFYSDGTTIYNAKHEIMENATSLSGNNSSTQSGIIIPYPNNRKKYVAVSIGIKGAGSLSYNILDIEANNGLGKLELPKKRLFTLPVGAQLSDFVESVSATKHANGIDFWIISVQRSGANSKMVAWLLTENGISTSPVTSSIPNMTLLNSHEFYGYLKISPNGKYFSLLFKKERNFLWGEFDNSTGVFTNIRDYYSFTRTAFDCYGGEFSANNQYLYLSSGTKSNKRVYVFDFQQLLQHNIIPLKTYELPESVHTAGTLQLGPDYRMYMTMLVPIQNNERLPSLLYLFDTPNDPLNTKVYGLENLSLRSDQGGGGIFGTMLGLPSFVSSFFMDAKGSSTICLSEEAVYTINTNAQRLEIDFDEGDRPIIVNNVAELKHIFKKPGNYLIKIRPLNSAGLVIEDEVKTVYTTVYSCSLPVNHNLLNADY